MTNQNILKCATLALVAIIIFNQLNITDYKLKPITSSSTILCFGDSLTFGTGAPPDQSYPALLRKKLNCTVINAGIPGETTETGMSRLPGLLDEYKPQLLILCEGGNDFLKKQSKNTKSNLAEMIKTAQNQDVEVLLIGVPRPGLLLSAADLYEELAAEHKTPLLNDAISEILSKGSLKSDYAHPNAAGYKMLAEEIIEVITK